MEAFDLAFGPEPPGPGARYVYLQDDRVLVDRRELRVLSDIVPRERARVLPIGRSADAPVFAVLLGPGDEQPAALRQVGLRELYGLVDDEEVGWASRAAQLATFERDHRFCGRCGANAAASPVEHARVCTRCGATVYPRLAPAVIVLVERGDACLLARSPRFPPGVHSAIAGFVEPGETAEHAVERELAEECGISATGIAYAGSQPWPFPHSLMLGFVATYAGGDLRVDGVEVESAGWFEPDALPPLPAPGSIARQLIEQFADRVSTRGPRRPGPA